MRASPARLLAAAVLLVAIAACRSSSESSVRTDEAAAALASIYAYAFGVPQQRALGPDVSVMNIVDAARILARAPSPQADTKRRRGIGMLAVAGTPPDRVEDPWTPPEIDAALRAIGAPMRQLAEAFLRERARAGSDDHWRRVDKQWVAYQLLARTAGPWQQKCCSCLNAWDVDPDSNPLHDPPDGVAMAYFKVSVPRSHKDVRGLMDPQSWAACTPEWFKATWVTATGPNATCEGAALCTADDPPKDPSPPNPNSVYQGTLFEHFYNAFASGPPCTGVPGNRHALSVRNVLRVAKTRTMFPPSSPFAVEVDRIDYGVCGLQPTAPPVGAIDSTIDCTCEQHGVDADCGQTRTWERTADSAWVEGFKYLKFSDRAIDYALDTWAAIGLRMMIDEIVDEGVCCGEAEEGSSRGSKPCGGCPEPLHLEDVTRPKLSLCAQER